MTEIKPSTRRFRDILSGVPKTETQPNVARLHSWDKMEAATIAANNYLVAAQGSRHKAEMELKDALEHEAEAEAITQALARLDRAQTPEDFEQSLADLEQVIRLGASRAQNAAGGGTRQQSAPQNDGWQDLGNGIRIREKR